MKARLDQVENHIATEGTKTVANFFTTQVDYILHCNRKVADLKETMCELEARKIDIEHDIQHAYLYNKEGNSQTKRWLSKLERLKERAKETVGDGEDEIEKTQVLKRRRVGECCTELMAEANMLLNEVSTLTTLRDSALPTFRSRISMEFNDYISVRGVLDEVINAIKDEKKSVVAIYGMGGIGKSTLVDQIEQQILRSKMFDVVIVVEVSQKQEVADIQNYIQKCITEQLGKTFKSETQKSRELADAIRGKNILIMLDNLWSEVDLREIGVPVGEKGCKILLTTRNIEVCNQMRTDARFSAKLLSEEDSWHLFKSRVEVGITTEIEPIAKEVACECANLPLALVVVGKALHDKKKVIWENALRQLRESKPKDLLNVEEKVFKCLEWSYNHLNRDDRKLLFLLCSLFPEGYELSVEELTRFRIGEDTFDKCHNLEEARENMHVLVLKLIDSCLLMRTKKKTKMHDVLRDVAIYIGSRNGFFIKSDSGTSELLERDFLHSKKMSLINCKISQLPNKPKSTELNVLLVRNNTKLISLPDSFFKYMKALKVLDLSDSIIDSLPSSLKFVKDLRVFSLNRCVKLCGSSSISIIAKLENLQILSWQSCHMEFLPKEIGELTKLKLLDLSDSHKLKLSSNVFSKLSFLEELYLDSNCLNKIVLKEIADLKKLSCLQLYIKEDFFSQDVIVGNWLENSRNYVVHSDPSWIKNAGFYRKNLHIRGAKYLAGWVKLLLREVENLRFDDCFQSVSSLLELVGLENENGFKNLKILRISNCHGIAYLSRRMGSAALEYAFFNLEELYLTNLNNFNGIFDGALSEFSFGKTHKLHITGCRNVFHMIPSDLLIKMHHNLKELRVKDCEELRGVFYFMSHQTDPPMFERLETLYLHDLPKLGAICHNQVPKGSFGNLTDLHIQDCNKLKYLFSASVITGFLCLEKIIVFDNANMEEIILDDGFILDEFALPKLMVLKLESLPKLSHFYKVQKEIKKFSWPLLNSVKLGICKNLKMLPIGFESAPLLEKIELVEQSDEDWYNNLLWDDAATSTRFKTFFRL